MGPDGCRFDVTIRPSAAEKGAHEPIHYADLHLPMAGRHNALNAVAAIAVARELGVGAADIRKGLAGFGGVRRRFTTTGVAGGVRIIDDYGHHPVEIASVLKAARAVTEGRVIAVVQPHRYSRLSDLFDDFCHGFNDADVVIVADVYAAGEAPLPGIDRDALADGLRRYGHRRVLTLDSPADLAAIVRAEARSGDVVVLLGAGDITAWSYALPGELEALGLAAE
ncbi:MAG TPA: cyanophycin synthetase, partial [Phenylobacterium sp.]|nr:cyanophycin synthetase [Phenylobacterium sp.]